MERVIKDRFSKDREKFLVRFQRQYNERINEPPTKAEQIKLGIIATGVAWSVLALPVSVNLWVISAVDQPVAFLITTGISFLSIPEGLLLARYGPDIVLNIFSKIK